MDKVIMSTRRSFGGQRIEQGVVSVDLWNDGVVLGAAWSMHQPEIEGELFAFRGTLERRAWVPRSRQWVLRHVDGQYISGVSTRKAALDLVDRMVTLDAFKALNRVEAPR